MAKRRATKGTAGPNIDRQILSLLKKINKKLQDIEVAIPDVEIVSLGEKLDEVLRELRSQGPAGQEGRG